MKKLAILSLAAMGMIAASSSVFAGYEVNTAPGQVLVDGEVAPGLAVHGFDVVAYFTDGKPVKGDAEMAIVHGDATYRFASQANLDAFKADPEKYSPAYGGYCAYGVAVGAKFDGDPNYWRIVDGKLYLNLDQNIANAFGEDVAGAIEKAEANWPGLRDLDPSKIN
ncbi:MAG: YHS domain-containing protein [Sneathiella sp.]|nr:YHS domain-containing protein [Sneathiella sp.]